MSEGIKLSKNGNDDSDAAIPGFYFSNSVKDVIHTTMGIEPNEIKPFSDGYDNVDEQITGFLNLTGDLNMMITLGMSRKTAAAFVVYMTGVQLAEAKDEDMCDGIAEIINMVAGQIKTQAVGRGYHLKVLTPFVAVGEKCRIVYKSKVENMTKRFRIGNLDFMLKVFYYHL